MGELTSTQWTHSCYEVRDDISIATVKEKIVTIDEETMDVLSESSRLRQIINPKRRVWITKPEYQKHTNKKEYEDVSKCDVYQIEDRHLNDFLKEKLGYNKWSRTGKRELCNSPYVYGTDISIEAAIRCRYENLQKHPIVPLNIGSLDIETDLNDPDKPISLITVICDKTIYTCGISKYMWNYGKSKGWVEEATIEDMLACAEELIGETLRAHGMKIVPHVAQDEKELLEWIFEQIHRDNPDYLFIWNLGFDISTIVARAEALGIDVKDLFCDRNIPKSNRYLRYYEDRKKTAHIVQKWNWLHCTSLTQYLDALAIFAQVRRHKSKESSYKLDDIMSAVLGYRKIDLDGLSHHEMVKYHYIKYWVYNIWDACLVQFGCWKTLDHQAILALTERSTLMDFTKQTLMLANYYHFYLLDDNKVFATTGKSMIGPYDDMLGKAGGAVLDAKNVVDMGIRCLADDPEQVTNVLILVSDIDAEAWYPNWIETGNMSKETKISTIVDIEGKNSVELEAFSSAISNPDENAVFLCSQYFGLPDFEQMEMLAARELSSIEIGDLPPEMK